MRTLVYILLSLFCLIILIVSCNNENDLHKDNIPPQIHIEDVRVGRIDSIFTDSGDTITINTTDNRPDTVLLNSVLVFSGRFTDNYALSSFRLKLMFDSISQPEASDGEVEYSIQRGWSIYDRDDERVKEKVISNLEALSIPESIQDLPIREGMYFLEVNVMDLAGNKDSVNIPVRLLYRKTVVENR